jgi:phytoene dehydrogenase-like protein
VHKGDLPVIVIVGGGIGGLYAAYLLGLDGYPVTVLERSDRWGGRIESVPLPDPSPDSFIAEFGPMRFEPGLQEKLRMVASDLQLEFIPFALRQGVRPNTTSPTSSRTSRRRRISCFGQY